MQISNLLFQLGIIIGTTLLLLVSLAWIDLFAEIRAKYPAFKNPLVGQSVYVVSFTIITIIFLMIFKPFNSDTKSTPEGVDRARLDERIIRDLPIK